MNTLQNFSGYTLQVWTDDGIFHVPQGVSFYTEDNSISIYAPETEYSQYNGLLDIGFGAPATDHGYVLVGEGLTTTAYLHFNKTAYSDEFFAGFGLGLLVVGMILTLRILRLLKLPVREVD